MCLSEQPVLDIFTYAALNRHSLRDLRLCLRLAFSPSSMLLFEICMCGNPVVDLRCCLHISHLFTCMGIDHMCNCTHSFREESCWHMFMICNHKSKEKRFVGYLVKNCIHSDDDPVMSREFQFTFCNFATSFYATFLKLLW